MAKYPHIVKCNGIWYEAGEDVPETEDEVASESSPHYSDSDIEFETKENKSYTKSEINRMTTADLQNLAYNNGFENAYEMTGGELKKILAEHFEL